MKFFILFALIAVAVSAAVEPIGILRQDQDVNFDGNFHYSFETENGIHVHETGVPEKVTGSFKYVSPEGLPVEVTYVADVNGFQPSGDVLPVGPPVPETVLRTLEYLRTHPPKDEKH